MQPLSPSDSDDRKAQGSAFIGIFHAENVRERVADRVIDVSAYAARETA